METAIIPGFVMDRLAPDEEARAHLNVLLSSLLVLALIGLSGSRPSLTGRLPHACLFRRLFGVPCPGCGVTSSLQAASRLELKESLRRNPAGPAVLAFLLAQVPLRSLALADREMRGPVALFSSRLSGYVSACLLLVWAVRLCARGVRG